MPRVRIEPQYGQDDKGWWYSVTLSYLGSYWTASTRMPVHVNTGELAQSYMREQVTRLRAILGWED